MGDGLAVRVRAGRAVIKVRVGGEKGAVQLASYLAEELAPRGIMPIIKGGTVILDDSSSGSSLSPEECADMVRRAAEKAGMRYRAILIRDDEVVIVGGELGPVAEEGRPRLFICPHCSFITPYEEEYWVHLKIHYAGF